MRPFALTWPQLAQQAMAASWTGADLERLRDAYEFAEESGDGCYRPQGEPLLTHLIRTASIALAEGLGVDAVVFALVHSSHQLHAFCDSRRRPLRAGEVDALRRRFGQSVHELLDAWPGMRWHSPAALEEHCARVDEAAARTRLLWHLRLINDLEDHLDRGMAFADAGVIEKSRARRAPLLRLAAAVGTPPLADELRAAIDANLDGDPLPAILVRQRTMAYERPLRRWTQRGALMRLYKRVRRAIAGSGRP